MDFPSQELDDAILEKESLTGKLQEADRRISVLYGSLMAAYAKLAYEQGLKDMAEIFAKSLHIVNLQIDHVHPVLPGKPQLHPADVHHQREPLPVVAMAQRRSTESARCGGPEGCRAD